LRPVLLYVPLTTYKGLLMPMTFDQDSGCSFKSKGISGRFSLESGWSGWDEKNTDKTIGRFALEENDVLIWNEIFIEFDENHMNTVAFRPYFLDFYGVENFLQGYEAITLKHRFGLSDSYQCLNHSKTLKLLIYLKM
jgi:hypothetical protein